MRSTMVRRLPHRYSVALEHAWVLFTEVQRVGHLARSQKTERLTGEGVHPRHHTAGVGAPAETVKAREQRATIAQAVQADAVEDKVATRPAVGFERAVGWAQVASLAWLGARDVDRAVGHEVDRGRHRPVHRTLHLADDGAERRPAAAGIPRHFRRIAHGRMAFPPGQALVHVVLAVADHHRTDDRKLVEVLR